MTDRRISAASIFVLVFLAVCCPDARADLRSDINAVLKDPYLNKTTAGVVVARLDDDGKPAVLFQHNAAQPLIPASNLKLITTAAALETFGADHAFETLLVVKDGDLYLIGDGDPTLGDAELLRHFGWDVTTAFDMWADLLKERGFTTINDVYVDDSVFDQEFLHPNWPMDQAHKRYVAQVGGLNLNANCLDFYLSVGARGQTVDYTVVPSTRYAKVQNTCKSGNESAVWLSRQMGGNEIVLRGEADADNAEPISVTIHDPAMFAGTVLAETLRADGITIGGIVQRDLTARQRMKSEGESGGWTTVVVHDTPLSTVLDRSNKDSMNLYAESLCKRLGHEMTGEPGSWANGTAALAKFLASCGVSTDQFTLDDGCGLSRNNTISAEAIVRVLSHMFAREDKQVYMSSLAVSGQDGTLKDRFDGSDLEGRVLAKSGYINRVSSLSGYVQADDGNWYAFSILLNNIPPGTNNRAKQIHERIVRAINANVTSVADTR